MLSVGSIFLWLFQKKLLTFFAEWVIIVIEHTSLTVKPLVIVFFYSFIKQPLESGAVVFYVVYYFKNQFYYG